MSYTSTVYVDAGGRGRSRLFVRDVGAGSPIVVVHGGPDFDHEYLLPELDRLAGDFRLVYYDQRGRGRSYSGEGPGDVTIESEAADLDRVRSALALESVAVLGHSWAALVALEYAVRHPDRVSHLVIMNPAPVSHADAMSIRRGPDRAARLAAIKADPRYERGDVDVDAAYYRIHFEGAVRDRDALERLVQRLRRAFAPEGVVAARAIEHRLYAQTIARDDYDLVARLGGLRVPTLVLHGDADFIPIDVARHIADAIPGARLVVLPDCRHFSYIDQPDLVRAALVEFVGGGG